MNANPAQVDDSVTINVDRITLRFDGMEPIVIPRRKLRTRLQLIEWVYRLTGWPGMNLSRMREFIAAVFSHHGWALPEPGKHAGRGMLVLCDELNAPDQGIGAEEDNQKLSVCSERNHSLIAS